ncbi:glycerate kinase [Thaumasiovibrio sp. DFM-14]|uniref:glycerate kinase n=1 Tax=Thaumasiovibrio sp. DFM-14 TaxID=3384792 RepID=UPI0039A34D68
MKIVIAPDSFKESVSAERVCAAVKKGIEQRIPNVDIVSVPMADGGEGTLDALLATMGGERVECVVMGPLPDSQVKAQFVMLGDGETAVIEMAQASGIELLTPQQRDPRITTTYGTGELIKAALDKGAKKLIVAIGGSATNDGGEGMVRALGARFLDKKGYDIGHGGAELINLTTIDISGLDPRLSDAQVVVACDVDNPLLGERGASAVFGPQKGATPEIVSQLDKALSHYAHCLVQELGKNVAKIPGSGAAGGLGAGLMAFLGAQLQPGIEIVSSTVGLRDKLTGADWVITGEGKLDGQSLGGKTPVGVAKLAQQMGIPVIALGGAMGEGADKLNEVGIVACFSVLSRPCTLETALTEGEANLTATAYQVAGLLSTLS